jgi:uncharacterized membrane protein
VSARGGSDDEFSPEYLVRGLPGHPLHPPLTDVTIGAYTFALVAATADVLGISTNAATHGWWLALVFGLISTVVTATTGFVDWLRIETGTPLWRTATAHMIANLIASAIFLAAAIVGKKSFDAGDVETAPYVLTVAGFLLLTLGGWLGGSIVFVHGMRVLNLVDEPARKAAAPLPTPEKREAEGA